MWMSGNRVTTRGVAETFSPGYFCRPFAFRHHAASQTYTTSAHGPSGSLSLIARTRIWPRSAATFTRLVEGPEATIAQASPVQSRNHAGFSPLGAIGPELRQIPPRFALGPRLAWFAVVSVLPVAALLHRQSPVRIRAIDGAKLGVAPGDPILATERDTVASGVGTFLPNPTIDRQAGGDRVLADHLAAAGERDDDRPSIVWRGGGHVLGAEPVTAWETIFSIDSLSASRAGRSGLAISTVATWGAVLTGFGGRYRRNRFRHCL